MTCKDRLYLSQFFKQLPICGVLNAFPGVILTKTVVLEDSVLKLLKGCHCYVPEDIGIKDILVVGGKIFKIDENIPVDVIYDVRVIDCQQNITCPGFIDQHVHILGGGGEEGPVSRIPEIGLSELTTAGVTTVVGF
jgi:beta-aspartyl-dipeptidase (metallo-type)